MADFSLLQVLQAAKMPIDTYSTPQCIFGERIVAVRLSKQKRPP